MLTLGYVLAAAAVALVAQALVYRRRNMALRLSLSDAFDQLEAARSTIDRGPGFVLQQGKIAAHLYPRPTSKRWVHLHRGNFRKEAIGDDYQTALSIAIEGDEFTRVDAFDKMEAGEVWEFTSEGKRTVQIGDFRAFRTALLSLDEKERGPG